MFDKSALPPDFPLLEHIDHINLTIARVRATLKERVPLIKEDDFSMISDQMEIFFQVQTRRALMLLDGAKLSLDSGHGLLTITAVRSIYETTACIHDCCNSVIKHLDAGDMSEAVRQIHQRTYSQRFMADEAKTEHFDYKAVNILNQIDVLTKSWLNARNQYEMLSEAVHPNAGGAVHYFVDREEDGMIVFRQEMDHAQLSFYLVAAANMFGLIYDDRLRFLSRMAKFMADELQKKVDDYNVRKAAGLLPS